MLLRKHPSYSWLRFVIRETDATIMIEAEEMTVIEIEIETEIEIEKWTEDLREIMKGEEEIMTDRK